MGEGGGGIAAKSAERLLCVCKWGKEGVWGAGRGVGWGGCVFALALTLSMHHLTP